MHWRIQGERSRSRAPIIKNNRVTENRVIWEKKSKYVKELTEDGFISLRGTHWQHVSDVDNLETLEQLKQNNFVATNKHKKDQITFYSCKVNRIRYKNKSAKYLQNCPFRMLFHGLKTKDGKTEAVVKNESIGCLYKFGQHNHTISLTRNSNLLRVKWADCNIYSFVVIFWICTDN